MKKYAVIFLCFIFYLLFSQGVWSQDFSLLDSDLQLLEDLIADTLINTQEQQELLSNLKMNLSESETLIVSYESIMNEQEALLKDLQIRLTELSEIYQMQSALSGKYEQRLKRWKTFTIVAIPVTAVVSGIIVWGVMR